MFTDNQSAKEFFPEFTRHPVARIASPEWVRDEIVITPVTSQAQRERGASETLAQSGHLPAWELRSFVAFGAWSRANRSDELIALDLSVESLRCGCHFPRLLSALTDLGRPAPGICLELPAAKVLEALPELAGRLLILRKLGFELALDGLPVGDQNQLLVASEVFTELKLEAQWLASGSPPDRRREVVHLAHSLGMRVTALGVDRQVKWNRARDAGCDLVQGSRVGPIERLGVLLPVADGDTGENRQALDSETFVARAGAAGHCGGRVSSAARGR